ncbi:hypothetical protein [Pseudoalteromonas xiamenensis]|uniref:Uncharacterized protein n=1 Tax=Pseudoalteromonas xiamenensis TaxID=882626 RepID=A0A975HMG3_9GAMM|nr:hypothetical protein [Pseudoalteromonas xiamenensis]QTH73074.1 hypothetical protein J5O05_19880 [Pseudoalteromonas xiamenensis]
MDTSKICDFGLYKGEPYTSLPSSFLNWMIASSHPFADYASQELNRRLEAVEASNHINPQIS